MDLRKALAAIPFSGDTAVPEPPEPVVSPWLVAAAVLAQFDPAALNSTAGILKPTLPEMTELLEASVETFGGGSGRRLRKLRPPVRRRVLASLGTAEAMRAALALNEVPDLPVQAGFAALLDGPADWQAVLDRDDPFGLAGLAEALEWVDGILPGLPPAEEVRRRLTRARLLQPMRKLVGEHFAGREDVLAQLAHHLYSGVADEVLMLQGPGGVGKSTVLAKFILDQLEDDPEPPTVILLNLDNPELVIDDPFTLIQEAGRQLRVQHPETSAALDDQGRLIASLQRRSRGTASLESLSGQHVAWEEITRIAAETMALVPGTKPILMVIDTFEEAQFTGPSAVERLMQLINSLKAGNQRLRVVLAGRVEAPVPRERTLSIGALDPGSARAVLEKSSGISPLPDVVFQAIFEITEGNPLSTHLAGRILAAEGITAFAEPGLQASLLGRIRSEQVQGRLYGRVLWHIHDPDVRKLAYPGLAVRRITVDVLMQVLSGPCDVAVPDIATAHALLDEFAAEVSLVYRDPQDGALKHRADVRRVMLDDLRRDRAETVAEIDRLAILYWQSQPGPVARAEEIYHRLAAGEEPYLVDARWEPGIEPMLSTAIGELPASGKVYLLNRLNLDLTPDLVAEADQTSWEQNVERTARGQLRDAFPETALEILAQRDERLPGSPLYLTEAEALQAIGQGSLALEVIERGSRLAEAAGERSQVVLLQLLAELIHERAGKLTEAARCVADAVTAAGLIENPQLRLRTLSAALRLNRKFLHVGGPPPEELATRAVGLIRDIGLNALFDTPGLLRELAAELGPRVPGLIDTAIEVTGTFVAVPDHVLRNLPRHLLDPVLRDSRALVIWMERLLESVGPQTDARRLLYSAVVPVQRLAAERLVADLLAAEIDISVGRPPSQRMQNRRKPWRDVTPAQKAATSAMPRARK
jgi:hypothetical protein